MNLSPLAFHAPSGSSRITLRHRAFSLIELLVVMAVMAVMLSFIGPAVSGLKGGADLASAAYEISDTLGRARAYAIARNTYVWVGIAEVDQALTTSAAPQRDGIGRVALSIVASKDGTRIYDENSNIASDWATKTASGVGLVQLGKLVRIENAHISDLGTPPAGGGMDRPAVAQEFQIGAAVSALSFNFPLGKASGIAQFTFNKVIQFDPQGTAKIVTTNGYSLLARQMEVGLQPAKGNVVPPIAGGSGLGNCVAIQINGLTGATAIYRP